LMLILNRKLLGENLFPHKNIISYFYSIGLKMVNH
jgi:hypothetical protein